MAQLGMQRFVDSPKSPRARSSPTVEQILQGDSSGRLSSTSFTLGKDHDQEEEHAHHNKKSVLTRVKEKARKLRSSLSKKKHAHDGTATPSWGVSLEDEEDDDEDPEYLGAPMYESELAPQGYKETARQHPRAFPMVCEKHVLTSNIKKDIEQEKENPSSTNMTETETETETESEKVAPANAVSDAINSFASKIAGLTVTTTAFLESGDNAGGGVQNLGGASETREHATGGQQTWDKGVSVKEYLMQKLEPGEDERALSEVITEAISPRKTLRDMGMVEKVREAVASLLHTAEYRTKSAAKTPTSSPHIPISTNAHEVFEEDNQERILQAN